jgi:hypothetical protein
MTKVTNKDKHPFYHALGPKARKVVRDAARDKDMSLHQFCEFALVQPPGFVETLLADHLYETGARKTKWGKK